MVKVTPSDAGNGPAGAGPEGRAATDALVGAKLGKYSVQRLIGTGGMGAVYEALDTFLKRRVAIKVLPDSVAASPEGLRRFVFEARAFAQVNHPNAVSIYEVDRRDGVVYIVLELMRGGSLHELLQSKGPLDWPQATQAVIDACKALVATHAAGLIHRDVKPSNLMLSGTGIVKLADFGLAKLSQAAATLTTTIAGSVIGTPHYMSPEQCRGEAIDFRSDVYALGATYYTLLTNKTPFSGDMPVQVLFAHCAFPVPDPRLSNELIPRACADIIARAMAKEPGERYGSAAEMLADLESLMSAGTQFVFSSDVEQDRDPADAQILAKALIARQGEKRAAANPIETFALPAGPSTSGEPQARPIGFAGGPLRLIACTVLAVTAVVGVTIYAARTLGLWPFVPAVSTPALGPGTPLAGTATKPSQPASASLTTRPIARAATRPFANRLTGSIVASGTRVTSLAFCPDGTRLAIGRASGAGGLQLWDTQAAGTSPVLQFDFATRSLSFGAGGRQLIAAAGSNGLVVRDWADGAEQKPAGAERLGSVEAVAFTKGGGILAAASRSGDNQSVVHLWEVRSWRETRKIVVPIPSVEALTFSNDAELLCIVGGEHVMIWRLKGPRPPQPLQASGAISAATFSPDGTLLALGGDSGVEFWVMPSLSRSQERWSSAGIVNALAFSSDSRLLAAGSRDGFLRFWKVPDSKEVFAQRVHRTSAVTALAFANGFHVIASGGADGTVRVIDASRKLAATRAAKQQAK